MVVVVMAWTVLGGEVRNGQDDAMQALRGGKEVREVVKLRVEAFRKTRRR